MPSPTVASASSSKDKAVVACDSKTLRMRKTRSSLVPLCKVHTAFGEGPRVPSASFDSPLPERPFFFPIQSFIPLKLLRKRFNHVRAVDGARFHRASHRVHFLNETFIHITFTVNSDGTCQTSKTGFLCWRTLFVNIFTDPRKPRQSWSPRISPRSDSVAACVRFRLDFCFSLRV